MNDDIESLRYWKEQCYHLNIDATEENTQYLMDMYNEAINSSIAEIDREVFDTFEFWENRK